MNKSTILNYLLSHPIFNDNNTYIGYYKLNGQVKSFEASNGIIADDVLDQEIEYIYETWRQLWNKNDIFITHLQFEERPGAILHWQSIFDSTLRQNSIFYENKQLNIQFNTRKQNDQNLQYQWLLWDFIYPITQWFPILWPNENIDGNVFIWYINYTELQSDLMLWYHAFKKIGLPSEFSKQEHSIFQETIPKTFHHWCEYYSQFKANVDECDLLL